MSRIGVQPIAIPAGVQVTVQDGTVTVKGPKGTESHTVHDGISAVVEDGRLLVRREADTKVLKSLHGLNRALLRNIVEGVSQGYQKTLELMGVGYRVQQSGKAITLNVGYTHSVEVQPLPGVELQVEGQNRVHVRGVNRQAVGQVAASIRAVRTPNAYKEKGIRYSTERIKLKAGKAAARKK